MQTHNNNNSTNAPGGPGADDLCAALLTPRQQQQQQQQQQHPGSCYFPPQQAPPNGTGAHTQAHPAADAAAAQRAMSSWKPAFDRRQSWDKQEYKHEVQKRECEKVKEGKRGGFTEGRQ
ncbi:hypothetical protein N658DRAFT_487851 [Parathielavia hyrcaniae]|uniref:Uncharacterized protein n=1 Tax=Parathielavia hyrcaniae TaxID=113614 RepID=A0AAN6Q041_9PEZI|nr:hypothetical protein N658DRAFT_487851 [Parathielavia hyrcaniae]